MIASDRPKKPERLASINPGWSPGLSMTLMIIVGLGMPRAMPGANG